MKYPFLYDKIFLEVDSKKVIKRKEENKIIKILVIVLNIIGILCLIYFAIPFIEHDMSIPNPNAMLAGYSWDACCFVITIGLIPLIIANTLLFKYIDFKNKVFVLYSNFNMFCFSFNIFINFF